MPIWLWGVVVLAYESDPRLCGTGPWGVLVLGNFLIPGYVDPGRGGTGPRLSSSIQISLSPLGPTGWLAEGLGGTGTGRRLLLPSAKTTSTWARSWLPSRRWVGGVLVLAYPALCPRLSGDWSGYW